MQIVILSRDYAPQPGDVHIENPRPPQGVACIDPQHGGHRRPWTVSLWGETVRVIPDGDDWRSAWDATARTEGGRGWSGCEGDSRIVPLWPDMQPGDCAATYAARLHRTPGALIGLRRIVLLPSAGVDDYVAAGILLDAARSYVEGSDGALAEGTFPRLTETLQGETGQARLRDFAAADCGQVPGTWAPGYEYEPTVADRPTYAGVGRLVKVREIPPVARAVLAAHALLRQELPRWLVRDVLPVLGLSEADGAHSEDGDPEGDDFLLALTALALRRKAEYKAQCKVRSYPEWGSPGWALVAEVDSPALTGDPSEGAGGFGLGYRVAPVAVCHYPLPRGRRKYSIGLAGNARELVQVDWAALTAALNEAEQAHSREPCAECPMHQRGDSIDWSPAGICATCATCGGQGVTVPVQGAWGGPPGMVCSPQTAGSLIDPRTLMDLVLRHVRPTLRETAAVEARS